jgi:hypothetical protein
MFTYSINPRKAALDKSNSPIQGFMQLILTFYAVQYLDFKSLSLIVGENILRSLQF